MKNVKIRVESWKEAIDLYKEMPFYVGPSGALALYASIKDDDNSLVLLPDDKRKYNNYNVIELNTAIELNKKGYSILYLGRIEKINIVKSLFDDIEINEYNISNKAIVICNKGILSEMKANELRERGIEAYSLIGGVDYIESKIKREKCKV